MPRLIVLNGPPGCGKSTLAQRYVDEHPLALNLDIDRIRSLIGQWGRDRPSAGRLARTITLAAARAHLSVGHDVVIPQFLARPDFLERVERLAGEAGADFHEVVLLDTKENALRRFADRNRSTDPAHLDTPEVLEHTERPEVWSSWYDELLSVIAARPTAKVVRTHRGRTDQAYRDFLAVLERDVR